MEDLLWTTKISSEWLMLHSAWKKIKIFAQIVSPIFLLVPINTVGVSGAFSILPKTGWKFQLQEKSPTSDLKLTVSNAHK